LGGAVTINLPKAKEGKYANKSPIFITNYGSATTTTIQDTSTG
jgi:hypothetical protein